MNGRRAGTVARRGANRASDAAKRAGRSVQLSVSRGADSLTRGVKRQTRDAGEWISNSSRSGMKRMGTLCRRNPIKCTTGMALAGYTAVNFAENSQAQQECLAGCLPPNWPAVVESNGDVAPEYFLHDPKPERRKHRQPQCTDGTDCEPYCVAACRAEHPTTILGAAMEGAGEMMDDVIVPFAEDVLGIPVTDIGGGVMWSVRVGVFVVGIAVIYMVGRTLGLWGRRREVGGRIALSINTPPDRPEETVRTVTPRS